MIPVKYLHIKDQENISQQFICFRLLPIKDWHKLQQFDCISALNLLDRCNKPLELLQQIKTSLKPQGIAILAVVIPFSPYVESGNLCYLKKN